MAGNSGMQTAVMFCCLVAVAMVSNVFSWHSVSLHFTGSDPDSFLEEAQVTLFPASRLDT